MAIDTNRGVYLFLFVIIILLALTIVDIIKSLQGISLVKIKSINFDFSSIGDRTNVEYTGDFSVLTNISYKFPSQLGSRLYFPSIQCNVGISGSKSIEKVALVNFNADYHHNRARVEVTSEANIVLSSINQKITRKLIFLENRKRYHSIHASCDITFNLVLYGVLPIGATVSFPLTIPFNASHMSTDIATSDGHAPVAFISNDPKYHVNFESFVHSINMILPFASQIQNVSKIFGIESFSVNIPAMSYNFGFQNLSAHPYWKVALPTLTVDVLREKNLTVDMTYTCINTDSSSCSLIDPFGAFISSLVTPSTVFLATSTDRNFFTSFLGRDHYINEHAQMTTSRQAIFIFYFFTFSIKKKKKLIVFDLFRKAGKK